MDPVAVREVLKKGPKHRVYQDRDRDGKVDVFYMIDTDDRHDPALQPLVVKVIDEDGFFDTWKIDIDGDSLPPGAMNHREWTYSDEDESCFERVVHLDNDQQALMSLDYWRLHSFYAPCIEQTVKANQGLLERIKNLLKRQGSAFALDPLEQYFRKDLVHYGGKHHVGEKIKNSRDGSRYYQDLLRERYWQRLTQTPLARKPAFATAAAAYERGDWAHTADLLQEHFSAHPAKDWYGGFRKRCVLGIKNPSHRWLPEHPIVVQVRDIVEAVPDFNPAHYLLVASERLVDDRVIPSQVDDTDENGHPDELVWVQSLAPRTTTEILCYYNPQGQHQVAFAAKAQALEDWDKNFEDIGWESNWCAYRMFDGQIDFLGKRLEGLYLQEKNYHQLADWGMDVLKIGSSAGLGGISLWKEDRPIPLMDPGGEGLLKIENAILSSGPVRSLVRVRFSEIPSMPADCEVTLLMSAYADNRFSQQDILIRGQGAETLLYSPGLMKLPQDQWQINSAAGTLASWGLMDRQIQDVGLGLVFSPETYIGFSETKWDRHVRLKIGPGQKARHYIVGTWRKGRTYRYSPDLNTWSAELAALGVQLRTPIHVTISQK